jgi:hypothetical protein
MTHEYTILVGGVVVRGQGEAGATAIAWAADTILAIGSDAEVLAISRGDSHVVGLHGAFVAGASGPPMVGGAADLDVLDEDPRAGASGEPRALIRAGRLVAGSLLDPPHSSPMDGP